MSERKIINLYKHFKNTEKKLKIVCGWDEVIQACEPYALWKVPLRKGERECDFNSEFFPAFLQGGTSGKIKYFPYDSKMEIDWYAKTKKNKQAQIKNSPDFYQQAPFLTIAEDLLKLIKEDKVEKLIFLSVYDKRKFPKGDERKYDIFEQTFAKLAHNWRVCREDINWRDDKCWGGEINRKDGYLDRINFHLIDFDTTTKDDLEKEKQEALNKFKEILKSDTSLSKKLEQTRQLIDIGTMNLDKYEKPINRTKANWIKENASDFDIVIDDNPNICKQIESLIDKKKTEAFDKCKDCFIETKKIKSEEDGEDDREGNKYVNWCGKCLGLIPIVIAPYYPAIEKEHYEGVLLVKNEVSELKKEDFGIITTTKKTNE